MKSLEIPVSKFYPKISVLKLYCQSFFSFSKLSTVVIFLLYFPICRYIVQYYTHLSLNGNSRRRTLQYNKYSPLRSCANWLNIEGSLYIVVFILFQNFSTWPTVFAIKIGYTRCSKSSNYNLKYTEYSVIF